VRSEKLDGECGYPMMDGGAIDIALVDAEIGHGSAAIERAFVGENVVIDRAGKYRQRNVRDPRRIVFGVGINRDDAVSRPGDDGDGTSIAIRLAGMKAGPSAGAMAKTARTRGSRKERPSPRSAAAKVGSDLASI
jgi:hypothetical protein